MSDLKKIVDDNFHRYAGSVIINRAICDARDMLKPSTRMLMYSQKHTTKNTPDKPFIKSARVVGDALGHWYTHSDGSCYATYMRMAKPWAMRYPLEDCQGNSGTITSPGDEAAARYTELRLSKLGNYLFSQIEKETIEEWENNFDDTEQYPRVLPSLGFYNIVNGTTGIAVALSSSVPQFNLSEVNNAMIKLLWNSDIDFDEIYCAPDFATGAILLNEKEIKQSLKDGNGPACKLRSVIEYDNKERALVVKELPYGVYTSTVASQIQKLVEDNPNCGIEGINDGSGKTPDFLIYLSKSATPEKVIKMLYKETYLQYYVGINMTVLEDGRYPKIYGWKELLQSHLNHEKIIYTRGFEFDLRKIEARFHIIDGLFICMARIDEVVKTIKESASSAAASIALQKNFLLDELQAKAVLDMKLSRLAHLEVDKLVKEKEELIAEKERIQKILSDEILFKKEIEKGLIDVANKFGDARRTKILNLSTSSDDEVIEEKQLIISLSNFGNLYTSESSTLISSRRGSVGNKIKLQDGEYIIKTIADSNQGMMMLFSSTGRFYNYPIKDFNINTKISIYDILKLQDGEKITNIISYKEAENYQYIVFLTRNGMIKKSLLSEYQTKKVSGAQGIKLKDNDEIISICFLNDEIIAVSTNKAQFVMFNTKEINSVGKIAMGVKAITLNDGDYVSDCHIKIADAREIVSVTKKGLISRTDINEFNITGRATKGIKIQKLNEDDTLAGFIFINNETEIGITSQKTIIKIALDSIPKTARGAIGVKSMKIKDGNQVIEIMLC